MTSADVVIICPDECCSSLPTPNTEKPLAELQLLKQNENGRLEKPGNRVIQKDVLLGYNSGYIITFLRFIPIGSMYGISTNIYNKNPQLHARKYTIHGPHVDLNIFPYAGCELFFVEW